MSCLQFSSLQKDLDVRIAYRVVMQNGVDQRIRALLRRAYADAFLGREFILAPSLDRNLGALLHH